MRAYRTRAELRVGILNLARGGTEPPDKVLPQTYRDVLLAKHWGVTPRELGELPYAMVELMRIQMDAEQAVLKKSSANAKKGAG